MTETERRRYVDEWKSSDTSMAAFCRVNGLKYATFRLWLKKFDGSKEPAKIPDPGLVRLEIPPAVGSPTVSGETRLSVHYGSYLVTVPSGFDVTDLTRVLLALKDLTI